MKGYSKQLMEAVAILEKVIASGNNDEYVVEAKDKVSGVVGFIELDDSIEN